MTYRSLVLASAFAVSLLGATMPQTTVAQEQEAPVKIAVVNIDQVIAQSAAGAALGEKLNAFQEEAQGQVAEQQKYIQDLRQKISDGVNSEDQAQLVNLRKQFEDATVQLRRFSDDKQREAQKIRADGMQEIQKQFDPVFTAIQEEFNYDLILNKQTGVVLLVGERVDITQMVIDRLQ